MIKLWFLESLKADFEADMRLMVKLLFLVSEMSSIDRYVAITRPLRYKCLITYNLSYTMIGVVWVVCAVLAMFPLIGKMS